MHDIVIRGGTIVDGTGRGAFTGEVAIVLTRSLTVTTPAAGNLAIRWASDRTSTSQLWSGEAGARFLSSFSPLQKRTTNCFGVIVGFL
jgi:hypothetical protein